jgi:hypothetical protein
MALIIRLIIRLFQLDFLAGIIFFSHNKSTNSVFQPTYQHSRMAPILVSIFFFLKDHMRALPAISHYK